MKVVMILILFQVYKKCFIYISHLHVKNEFHFIQVNLSGTVYVITSNLVTDYHIFLYKRGKTLKTTKKLT